MSTDVQRQEIARGVLLSLNDGRLVLGLPGTDYQIHLVPAATAEQIPIPVGKRIKGVIEATGLRVFTANGGGRFIEPICGEPRIVAGTVLAVNKPGRRLLVDVAVPMWMTLRDDQRMDRFRPGDLVNGYVESGTTFSPV